MLDEVAIWNGTGATAQNAADLYNSGNGALASSIIPNPTAYWRFDESGTDIVLTDEKKIINLSYLIENDFVKVSYGKKKHFKIKLN